MGRELFGDDEADASGHEEGASVEAPATASLAEPPAPSATVQNIQMPCAPELVSVPLLCLKHPGRQQAAPARSQILTLPRSLYTS